MYNNKLSSYMVLMIMLVVVALFSLSMKSVEANESKSLRENIQHELANTNNIQASAACQFLGNYCDSCQGCYRWEDTLVCQCYTFEGVLDGGTTLNISGCQGGYIMNVNSDLTCFRNYPLNCKYPGKYCQSCSGCTFGSGKMTCQCQDPLRRQHTTSFNPADCAKEFLENSNGYLRCYPAP